MVGTRHASEHGLTAARSFSRAFAAAGIAVTSGLAFGVDAASHRGALDGGGKTIAVVGSGIDDDSLYPRANLRLALDILSGGGLILSENPPGTKPQNWDFPKRNRLIAALARATVAVEAPQKSGALITVKYALELGREVYAVPGDALRASSRGSNELIASGATPLLDPDRLIEAVFPGQSRKSRTPAENFRPGSEEEALILGILRQGSAHADELAQKAGIKAQAANAALTSLELRGAVTALGNMRWCLTRRDI
jgi:DNA processing protein